MVGDGSHLSDRSVADLLKQASDQTTTLVRQEIELAKAELTTKGKQVGLGAGMFGGAGVFGLYAFGALTAAIILALSLALTAGWPRSSSRSCTARSRADWHCRARARSKPAPHRYQSRRYRV
jgi:Putative Actinobacterial Holin-X, holin superfamily III